MKSSLSILLLTLLAKIICAQDPYYITIDKSKGLPSNNVYDIFQDSKGFIWIGNDEGLTRYDGYEFKTYTCAEQTSKPGSYIKEDKYGRIWYQNFDGYIYYVENDTMKTLKHNKPTPFNVFGIANNKLYKIQREGVDVFSLKTLQYLKTIFVDHTNWITSSRGTGNNFFFYRSDFLYKIDHKDSLIKIPHPKLPSNKTLGNIIRGKNEIILVSLYDINSANVCYELKNDKCILKFDLKDMGMFQNVTYTDDCYWFCTRNGVYAFTEAGKLLNKGNAFFPEKNISAVLKDREGNFWVSTPNEGIFFVRNIYSSIIFDNITPYKFDIDKDDLYIGTQDGKIYTFNLNSFSPKILYTSTTKSKIYDLKYEKESGNILIADFGFKIKKNKTIISKELGGIKDFEKLNNNYYASSGSGSCTLFCLDSTTDNEWDRIYYSHLINYKPESERYALILRGVRGKSVAYNYFTNCIYYATNTGLYKLTPDTLYEIKNNNSSVYCSKLCSYNNFVYALSTSGQLLKLNNRDSVENLSKKLHIENANIINIKIDSNFLFLATTEQLLYVNLKNEKSEIISTGIYLNEINDLLLWKDKLILASNNAVLMQNFNANETNTISPKFIINSFTVNNSAFNSGTLNKFNSSQNNIEIKYSILSFKTNFKFPLYYKINNNNWELAPAESRLLRFTSLSPGNYKIDFHLGELTDNNYPEQTIQFIIGKPWWQQWWFITICITIFLILIYAYYKRQTKRIIKQNKLLADKNELEKNLNKSILTSIKAQMNPHFFYNALNTIQSFIFTDDKKNATSYLSKFSILTRMILEMSEKEQVTLQEELQVLNIYLEIEKERFDGELEFTISVAQDLHTDWIQIPSMIIQPYVENAIKHGLLHKKHNRTLKIDFKNISNNLIVTIDDNGIGRKQSEQINKRKQGKYASFSTKANQTRLELLNKERNNKMVVEFIDKVDETKNPVGTTVMITIPIL